MAERAALKTPTWRHSTKTDHDNPAAAMRSRLLALRIRPANRDITPAADGSFHEAWLLAERPTGANEPTNYWISTLVSAAHLFITTLQLINPKASGQD